MKRILLKLGGRSFESQEAFTELAQAIQAVDAQVIIVHGGGSEISQALKDANRETRFIDGIRVTEKKDIEIVDNVLSNVINSRISGYLEQAGVKCTGMAGKTNGTLIAEPIRRQDYDYGFVGQIKAVNPGYVWQQLKNNAVPVVSPISADEAGNSYNVNADSAAAALAVGSQCTDLIYFSDVPGVKANDEILASLTAEQTQELIAKGIIRDGMVAKMESAFYALNGNVERVHITCWQGPKTLAQILDQSHAFGTTIHI